MLVAAACVVTMQQSVLAQAPSDVFASQVQADTKWLNDFITRQVGTKEHAEVQKQLLEKVKSIPDVEVWTDEFPVVVPVYSETYLQIGEGKFAGQNNIFPLWPDGARLNTTPANGIQGKLIYIGDAAYDKLPATGLRHQIAVMEMSAYDHYRRAFDLGAKAVIFVESEKVETPLPTDLSLYKPRYYVPAGPLADALRRNEVQSGTIFCKGQWKTVTARNIYAAVKPADTQGELPYALVAPYDSMSKVYGVAPGADAALDSAFLLNLLREASDDAPRPLLFGFIDAYHHNQLGMRRMAAMLAVTPGGLTRKVYDDMETESLEAYVEARKELESFETPEEGLSKIYDRSSYETLRRLFKDAVGRDLLLLRELQSDLRLTKSRRDKEAEKPAVRHQAVNSLLNATRWLLRYNRDELSEEQIEKVLEAQAYAEKQLELMELQGDEAVAWTTLAEARDYANELFEICYVPLRRRNAVTEAAFDGDKEVKEADMDVALAAWDKMAKRVRGQVREQTERLEYFKVLDGLRDEIAAYFGLDAEQVDSGICPFLVGFDLSDAGVIVGPGKHCGFNRIDMGSRDFLRALKSATKQNEIWAEDSPERQAVNIDAMEGRVASNITTGHRAMITSPASSFNIDNITWITDDAPRQRIDTPLDRYDQLNWDRITPQFAPTRTFLDWLFTSDAFEPKLKPVKENTARWRHGMGKIVDVSAGETVPRVPRPGFLITLDHSAMDVDGIRRQEYAWTGEDGEFRVPLLPADVNKAHNAMTLEAFMFNDAGAINESISTAVSQVSSRLATSFELNSGPGERLPRAVTFSCVELNGPSFYDARFLEPLTQGSLLDAVRGGSPKQSVFKIDPTGQMWGLVPPGVRWQLVVRAGASGVRMALLNSIENGREQGLSLNQTFRRGYAIDTVLPTIPPESSARDIWRLNLWRLQDFNKAGISSDKVDEIRDETEASLERVDAAKQADDGSKLHREATKALASELRAYAAITETGDDVARGAIFLMLILVPFSIAMERLLFAFSRIGYQIGMAIGIFALMTIVLWSFHPAFQISAQPLVIVMSFTILSMSVAVISIVMNRFRSSMREFQSSLAEGSGAQMGRGGLLGSAVFLGIANMRKRKMRTALTGSTLVLVTFALLCFSSASSYVDKKNFALDGVVANQSAVMVRRPTFGPINWLAADSLGNLLSNQELDVQSRAWLGADLGDTKWRMWMINPKTGKQVAARGVLGLPEHEDKLTGIDRVLPNWSAFAADGGCYLPAELAEQLGVEPGDNVVIRGYDLKLQGVFDPIALEDEIDMLDGQRILPYDYSRQEKDWVDRDSQDAIEQEMQSASSMQPTSANEGDLFMAARDTVILPTSIVRKLDGTLRSLAIPVESPEQAKAVSRELMQTIVYPVYYANDKGGVNVIVATPLIAVPPGSIAVPLVIAALIIFTTMLNSVSERKKEIYVYSSLGLAPTHIGALFVAEALTYGLMGSVFGYIAGQAFATVLTSFGLMQGITLNYSGTAVIRTMLLVQGVVVLSAIVPAIMAGRIASPSKEMDWKVPEPVDGEIKTTLPFTVSPTAASGLIAFIYEYLEAHRDGVLGRFDVDDIQLLPKDPDGKYVAGLESRVWLAPFDMGVRQMMRLTIEPPDDGVCEIAVSIFHETGTPKLWWRLNKPYFYELRRQLLGWRKVTQERVQGYIEQMETMMDDRVVT